VHNLAYHQPLLMWQNWQLTQDRAGGVDGSLLIYHSAESDVTW